MTELQIGRERLLPVCERSRPHADEPCLAAPLLDPNLKHNCRANAPTRPGAGAVRMAAMSIAACFGLAAVLAGPPLARVISPQDAGLAILRNGNFETATGGRPLAWNVTESGVSAVRGEGRAGSVALRAVGDTNQSYVGAAQWLTLNRARPFPIVVRGWSRAENISGGRDLGYSLMASVTHHDDTRPANPVATFRPGTHDWEFSEVVFVPEKPIKTLGIYCYLRGRTGTAWFDDVEVLELQPRSGVWPLHGAFVKASPPPLTPSRAPVPPANAATEDGLSLHWSDGVVANVRCHLTEIAPRLTGGFFARDVTTNSDFFPFENGVCTNLDLKLSASVQTRSTHLIFEGQVEDLSGRDRAVTLHFGLPVELREWRWADDLRNSRVVSSPDEYLNTVPVEAGASGQMSRFPLGAIVSERHGLALALDPAAPALFRVGCHGGLKQFFLAYDFGLVADTTRFPRAAKFRFVLFRFDPQWGFRAAWDQYSRLFPDAFAVRIPEQGQWAPPVDLKTIKGWRDFSFRFHETDRFLRFDDENDILSFRTSEPLVWRMPFPKDRPRTLAEVLRTRDELAGGTNLLHARLAAASAAAMHDSSGQPFVEFRSDPGREPVAWSLNPNPLLPGPTNAAKILWSDGVKLAAYGGARGGILDGEWLDSLDSPAVAELDFRREHLAASDTPLTFGRGPGRPAVFKGLAAFEFVRWLAADLRHLDKRLVASGLGDRFSFLQPEFDAFVMDTTWLRGEVFQPPPEAQLAQLRTLAGAKPVLLRLNADFNRFDSAMIEAYLRRALAYGFWPGMAAPYWQNAARLERDRALFRRYLPLVKLVAEAGWQPVTHAACDKADVLIERFGPDANGTVYFTLFNHTEVAQSGLLQVNLGALNLPPRDTLEELVSERAAGRLGDGWYLFLEPGQVAVVQYPR